MLVKTIMNAEELKREFQAYNRDYYSYEACQAIIDFFEETGNGEPQELDIIALCGDFNEETSEDIKNDYDYLWQGYLGNNTENPAELTSEEEKELFESFLNWHTWAIETTENTYLYLAF